VHFVLLEKQESNEDTICLGPLILCLSLTGFAESTPQSQSLTPGQPVEREIAGGQMHSYQIKLVAGQFMRVVVEQKSIDVSLVLVGSDGKPLLESDLTDTPRRPRAALL